MGWENDTFVMEQVARNAQDLKDARKKYSELANEELGNIARGDSFNPWLKLQRFMVNRLALIPGENDAMGEAPGLSSPVSDSRSERWDKAVQDAENIAARGGGHYASPKRFEP